MGKKILLEFSKRRFAIIYEQNSLHFEQGLNRNTNHINHFILFDAILLKFYVLLLLRSVVHYPKTYSRNSPEKGRFVFIMRCFLYRKSKIGKLPSAVKESVNNSSGIYWILFHIYLDI